MTTERCAYCGTHVPDSVGERVGIIRFCGRGHIVEWFSLPQHDRRTRRTRVEIDRRGR